MNALATAEGFFRKAERTLSSARLLLTSGSAEGACNRAYYAMHDAAHAALLAEGHETPDTIIKTHQGLIAQFSRHIVQSGKVDIDLGRAFNRVEDIRLAADYSCEPPPLDKAEWAVEKAEAFVAAVRLKFFPAGGA